MSSEAALPFLQTLCDTNELSGRSPESTSGAEAAMDGGTVRDVSDEILLQRIATGDKDSLGLLFQRHARSVFHVAWRILRNEAEASDLRQDVFLYLFEQAHRFESSKGSAVSWMMQITYHRAFNRRKYLDLRHGDVTDVFEEHGINPFESLIDRIDGMAILERLHDQLSPAQQRTLELHIFEGYTLREIAEQTGETLVNVRHHYYRALDRLRTNVFPAKRSLSEKIGKRLHRKGK